MRIRNITDGAVHVDSSGDEDNMSDILVPAGIGQDGDIDWQFVNNNNTTNRDPVVPDDSGEVATGSAEQTHEEANKKESFTEKLVSNMLNFCLDESEKEDTEEPGPSGLQQLDDKPEPSKILNIEAVPHATKTEENGFERDISNLQLNDEVTTEADWTEATGPILPELYIQGGSLNAENRIMCDKPIPLSDSCLKMTGKLSNYDGQYIKRHPFDDPENGELLYSGKFRSGSVEFKLHREGCLLTSKNSYVARVSIGPVNALDQATSFREAREILLKHLKIVKVLLDEDLQESKKARSDFETCMNEICTETTTNLQNAEDLLQLYNIVHKGRSQANRIMTAINENQYISDRVKQIISKHVEKETVIPDGVFIYFKALEVFSSII